MAKQTINLSTANDGLGDTLRDGGDKINDNFTELYAGLTGNAPLASPAFTGVPTAPTAAPGTNTTQIATMAAIQAAIALLVNSSPGTLDTLKELADALADDPNFAATMTTALAGKQPLDADLTAIAALTTTSYGRSLLTAADAAALRTLAGTVIGTNVQAFSAALALYAAISPSANIQSFLGSADYAAMRTLLGLVVGTNVQAYDADLAAIAALTSAANKVPYATGVGTWALADLTAFARTLLDDADAATMRGTMVAAASGANTDITSLASLSTPLSIAQGGTAVNTLAALLTSVSVLVQPLYVAGRWYWAERTVNSTGVTLGTNQIRLNCFVVKRSITISDLFARVTTVSAGGNFQLAIYAANAATMLPTGNPIAATGNISTAVAGAISADITGADVALTPGLYWVGVNADNSVAILQGNGAGPIDAAMIGSTTLANMATGTLIRYVAQTFGTWPDLTSASFTENGSVTGVALGFKVSVGG